MAVKLSKRTDLLRQGIAQKPQLVLEIDGVASRFGIGVIKKFIRVGDAGLYIDGSWKIGGYNAVEDQEDLISFDGTTPTISQQLLQDKGGTSSISAVQIALIDKDGIATDLISPGVTVEDILGRKANVYLGYTETAFPDDFVIIFAGIIDEVSAGGIVTIQVAHPEAGKRFDIFQKGTTKLTAEVNYKSAIIQGLRYITRRGILTSVTITYIGGGVNGTEVVSVLGSVITVQLEEDVSTAAQIRTAIENSIEALALVSVDVIDGTTLQSLWSSTLDSTTTLQVEDTTSFLEPGDGDTFKTYVQIEDEVIEYTGKTDTSFTGCVRAAFEAKDKRTRGNFHEVDTEVTSFYRLQGNALELALKLMLSGEDEYFLTDKPITAFQNIPELGVVPNAIYFQGINISDKFGIVPGDFMTVSGDDFAGNNFSLRTITDVQSVESGSYLIISGADLTTNVNTTAVCSLKSKYNVLPTGCGLGLGSDQVDVPEFERLMELFFSSIFTYDFYLTETEKGKDFIDTDLLFPTGAYTLPRKGKISVGYTSPPLSVSLLPVLDSSNTEKPQNTKIRRTINKYFYNNVLFKYNTSVLDTKKYLKGNLDISVDSKNKITVGDRVFTIPARGLRSSAENDAVIDILQKRFLERYRFAAEFLTNSFFYGPTFNIDVGDAVLFGDQALKVVDTRNATRGFSKRIFEVVNKSLNIKTGEVILDLVDTNYLSEGRYGVFGPASLIDTGSTTTVIKIKDSFSTTFPNIEKQNWDNFIGEKILVHDEDWTFSEETTLMGFDPSNNYKMLVSPALSMAPQADWIVDMPNYPGVDDGGAYKNQNCFFDPSVAIDSGDDEFNFDVLLGDVDKFFIGATLLVHNDDFSELSPEVKVTDIDGTKITVSSSLGFTPDSDHTIELVGFVVDEGYAYRFF